MNRLGPLVIEDQLTISDTTKQRETVRAILINKDYKIGLLYSKVFKDYTFPGGGVKPNESYITALQRELREEIGAVEITGIKLLGYTEELKYGLNENKQTYLQKSYYYFCHIDNFDIPDLQGREQDQGLSFDYVDVCQAIKVNKIAMYDENHHKQGIKTALKREEIILLKLKELINEKI